MAFSAAERCSTGSSSDSRDGRATTPGDTPSSAAAAAPRSVIVRPTP
jgi:hypothetical protein